MKQARSLDTVVRTPRRAVDHPDVALWRLVQAGAPSRWLWLESESVAPEQDLRRSVLGHGMHERVPEEQDRVKQGCLDHKLARPRHTAAILRELRWLSLQWRKHWCAS